MIMFSRESRPIGLSFLRILAYQIVEQRVNDAMYENSTIVGLEESTKLPVCSF